MNKNSWARWALGDDEGGFPGGPRDSDRGGIPLGLKGAEDGVFGFFVLASKIDAGDENRAADVGSEGERGLPIAEPYQCVGRDVPRRSGLDRFILHRGDLIAFILRLGDLVRVVLRRMLEAIDRFILCPRDLVLGPIQGMARSHPDLLVQDVVPVFCVELGDGSPRVEEVALDAIDRFEAAHSMRACSSKESKVQAAP